MDGRIYQNRALDAIWEAYAAGEESALAVLPTGTGKSRLAAMAAERMWNDRQLPTLFLAHRKQLVNQAHRTFDDLGLDASVEMGGQDGQREAILFGDSQVVVGSMATMQKARLGNWSSNQFGLIIVDECHHALADSYANILSHFGGHRLLGITATPDRGDQRNLGSVFKTRAFVYPLGVAIKGDGASDPGGWLVPPRIRRCPVTVDLKGIRAKGNDLNVGDLEERIGPKIEELADAIRKEVGGRITVVFTPDVGSAQAMAYVLNKLEEKDPKGMAAEYVSGSGGKYGMPEKEREEKMARFERGEFQILVNCELLFEGWDHPPVKAVVNCRPTKLRYRYAQMVGRGLRPCPETGFFDCLVIDFDWEQDEAARDLAMVVDLFDDGSSPEEVMRVARQIEREAKGTREDPMEIVEEAQEVVRVRNRLQIQLTGKQANYRAIEIDPFGVGKILDLGLKKKHDFGSPPKCGPASEAQIAYLKSLGILRADGMSKWGASKMLDKLTKRRDQGLASVAQVQELMVKAVSPDIARALTADSARHALGEIARIEKLLPKVQKDLSFT